MLQVGDNYKNFIVTKSIDLEELHCTLLELVHKPTGAKVLSIQTDDPENLFCLSFRTLPASSNGVAHILEHTVLTGSEKFPVKDPFFSMTRRSLNTFMNALTGSDFTCYPAASQVEQDFYNLLEVYLDAVFHPELKKLSFAQEGHRLEFAESDNPSSPLEIKGIVYNEMKGALSSPTTRLNEALTAALFPNTPYGFNAGGDPVVIPKLTYDELKKFHETYYHPSHCLFFFYGNLSLEKHLDFIDTHILQKISKAPPLPAIPKQPRFIKEVRKELTYPASLTDNGEEEAEDKTIIGFSWLTTEATENLEILALSIIDSVLMDTDASPLKRALLSSKLCKQANSSLDSELAEVPYTIVVRGAKAEDANAIETLIRNVFIDMAQKGLPERLVESTLHQIELERLEIAPDGGPFGLTLFARAALMKQHGGNAEDGLRIHSLFDELHDKLRTDPYYLRRLIQKYFIDNHHFVRISMIPEEKLAEREAEEERKRIDVIAQNLTPIQVEEILDQAKALKALQERDDSELIAKLPKIALKDVPKRGRSFPLHRMAEGNLEIFSHYTFTNQLTYTDLVFPLPEIAEHDLWLVRLFAVLAPQLGMAGRSFVENLEYIQENTGGLGCNFSFNHQVQNTNSISPTFHVRSKALYRKADKMFQLLFDAATSINCTERERIKELILKHATNLQSAFNQNALKYALNISAEYLNSASHVSAAWYGIDYFHKIKHLARHFDTEAISLIENLMRIQNILMCNQDANLIVCCDETEFSKYVENGFEGLTELPLKPFTHWKGAYKLVKPLPQGRIIAAPVAYSVKAFTTVPYTHPDSAAIAVASNIFDNVTLHKKIREQGGAYGGGTTFDPTAAFFYFYSYRDPAIASTITAFDDAITSTSKGEFTTNDLEEAKLGMIQALDSPVTPGARAEVSYSRYREGKTDEIRQAFREKLMNVTPEMVSRVTADIIYPRYLDSVFVTFAGKDLLEKENQKLLQPLKIEKA